MMLKHFKLDSALIVAMELKELVVDTSKQSFKKQNQAIYLEAEQMIFNYLGDLANNIEGCKVQAGNNVKKINKIW